MTRQLVNFTVEIANLMFGGFARLKPMPAASLRPFKDGELRWNMRPRNLDPSISREMIREVMPKGRTLDRSGWRPDFDLGRFDGRHETYCLWLQPQERFLNHASSANRKRRPLLALQAPATRAI